MNEPWIIIVLALSISSFFVAFYALIAVSRFEKSLSILTKKSNSSFDNLDRTLTRQRIATVEIIHQIEDKLLEQDRKANKKNRELEKLVNKNSDMNRKIAESFEWASFDDETKEVVKKTWQQHLGNYEPKRILLETEEDEEFIISWFHPMDMETMAGSHFLTARYDSDRNIQADCLLSATYEEMLEAHEALLKNSIGN